MVVNRLSNLETKQSITNQSSPTNDLATMNGKTFIGLVWWLEHNLLIQLDEYLNCVTNHGVHFFT